MQWQWHRSGLAVEDGMGVRSLDATEDPADISVVPRDSCYVADYSGSTTQPAAWRHTLRAHRNALYTPLIFGLASVSTYF